MARLTFKNEQLKNLVALSDAHKVFKVTFDVAISNWEKATGKEYDFNGDIPDEYYLSRKPTLFFVKDSGIYLMTGAVLEDYDYKTRTEHVCFAVGYNPSIDGDVWDKCRFAVGGDDFGENIFLTKEMRSLILQGCDIIINVTESQLTIKAILPARKSKAKIDELETGHD